MLSEGINQKSEAHTESRQEDLSRGVLFTALTSRPCYIHMSLLCNQTTASSHGAETDTHTPHTYDTAFLVIKEKKKIPIVFAFGSYFHIHDHSEDTVYLLCNGSTFFCLSM